MGKWLQRLALKIPHEHCTGTAKTDTRGVLSVLAVVPQWVAPEIQAASINASACADCLHLLRRGTCGEPVAAGLLADGFGIVWPPAGHATSCRAFMPKPAPEPAGRPYRLSAAEADRCHASAWDEGETGRFVARVSLFLRRGVGGEDADDLAERLVLRDRDGDDRRACVECRNLAGHVSTRLRCKAARAAGVAPELPAALVMQQQRCPAFAEGVAR